MRQQTTRISRRTSPPALQYCREVAALSAPPGPPSPWPLWTPTAASRTRRTRAHPGLSPGDGLRLHPGRGAGPDHRAQHLRHPGACGQRVLGNLGALVHVGAATRSRSSACAAAWPRRPTWRRRSSSPSCGPGVRAPRPLAFPSSSPCLPSGAGVPGGGEGGLHLRGHPGGGRPGKGLGVHHVRVQQLLLTHRALCVRGRERSRRPEESGRGGAAGGGGYRDITLLGQNVNLGKDLEEPWTSQTCWSG